MAITTALCTSFKVELFRGIHDFRTTGDSFKMALYTSSASLAAGTTAYTATDEVPSGGGYTTTGKVLTNIDPTSSGTTAFCDFADVSWTSATFTARGALIYNDTETTPVADPAVSSHDFGGNQTVSSGTFSIVFPAADASNAIIRIS